ncbi:uncharacterized protein (TIGR02231 family) [Dokdonia sp. Hel_I_63]|uniref:DUF4139 domain-containing protein n=1 Tax=Dokdonia sp. Hel_I_63 TaxID=1249996 RepID=UPI001199C19A|nr:DUF4139 domain-containing protein [Dokdonia sp. Hel_I_63]TVZ23261.1 uncharacterized protein (TIGR02231 family) [Dokdonia sp. Hel_I_63]
MKRTTLLLALCLMSYAFAKASSTPPQTKSTNLSKVTVYLSGAQIERTADVMVTEGTNSFLFDNLSNDIDESSIQISGLKNTSILSINFGINYLTEQLNTKKVDSLRSLKTKLETDILKLNSLMSGLHKEEEVITANQRLGSNTTEIDLAKIKELSTYYRKRVTEIKNAILDAEIEKTNLQRRVNDLTKQFNEFNVTEEKSKGQITLKLNGEQRETLKLKITYNVSEAGWYPEYDLKAITTNAPLQLSYKAHLYQKTGIDWDDVNLVLSTGDPNTNNLKPTIDTKYLRFVNRNYRNNSNATKAYNYKYNPTIKTITGIVTETNGPLPGATVVVKGTTNGTQTDFDGKYTLQVNEGETLQFSFVGYNTTEIPIHASIINANLEADNALEEVVVVAYATSSSRRTQSYAVTTVESEDISRTLQGKAVGVSISESNSIKTATGDQKTEGITTTTFEINKKYSIVSDGDVTVIEIDKFEVPATYEYFVAPAINENVFLTASIKDWVRYSLLPGEANIYFEGSFSGKTYINPLETTEELSVSLGVDPNIIVKRKQLDNFKSTSFIGSQRIVDMAYSTTVKNNKTTGINLKMVDRVPVSQNKEIKVDDIETSDATYDKDTGLLEWTIKLAPSDSSKKEFSYELKYSKHKRVNL